MEKQVKKPVEITWEVKDRIYYLKGDETPLTLTIPSKHTKKHALLYFDEDSKKQKEIRYATNQDSCFVDEPEVNVLLTVHDELVTITPDNLADEVASAIREPMEGVKLPDMVVPLIADTHIVQKWGQAK